MTALTSGAPSGSSDTPFSQPPLAECKLVSGGKWRDYKIGRPVPDGPSNTFEAVKLDVMETVTVRASPILDTTEWRRGAWQRLSALENVALVGCLEAVEEEGWRYEVSRQPPGSTLTEWFACHQAGYEAVEALMGQLAEVLNAIHAEGVVHLGLNPDVIFVDPEVETLRIVVGGLQEATLYTQSEITIPHIDSLYAPPEAAGRERHPPGTGLCAWDWWSVGRIVQQFVLGRHIVPAIKSEIAKNVTLVREAGLQLLLEQDPPGMRAGAIEAMGSVDPVIKTLLQGLLTSARDARWSGGEVRRWLARETVAVHYGLPTRVQLFVWKGRGLTLAAAAEHFVREEAWDDGEYNLFTPTDPATLAHFLQMTPSHAGDWKCLESHLEWMSLPAWADVPVAARRTIAAAVAWLALGRAQGLSTGLLVRGRRIDAEGLTSLLESVSPGDAIALAKALMETAFAERLSALDAPTTAVLYDLATLGGEALRRAVSAGWVAADDAEAQVRMLCLALEPERALATRVERLRTQFVGSRDAELARLLTDRSAPPWAEVILAFTGERAAQFGYISPAQWKRERLQVLSDEATTLRGTIFWRQMGRLLQVGFMLSAPWWVVGLVTAGLLAVGGLVAEKPGTAICAAILVGGTRWLAALLLARWVALHDPSAAAWGICDGPRRCAQEATRFCPSSATTKNLMEQLAKAEAAKAALQSGENFPAPPVSFQPLWAGAAGALVLLVLVSAHLALAAFPVARAWTSGPSQPEIPGDIAHATQSEIPATEAPGSPADLESGKFEYIDEGFGRRLRGPLQPWTLHAPQAPVAPLPVVERVPARPFQTAHALVSLELLLQPYARDAVHALIAVRVPSADGLTEMMILNSRSRRPLDLTALRLGGDLDERTWYQYDRKRVVFLGEPPQLAGEISLAPQ